MTKIANGVLNEKNIDALVRLGTSGDFEVFMISGARFTISAEDAAQFLPKEDAPAKP